jgi:dTDP-4-amino-4,6-dideoxygalactose transaminase
MTVEYENLRRLNAPFEAEYKAAFDQVLDSGWFILGKNVEAFENEFAQYIGAKHFLGCASGLDALEIPLKCWDFPKGSEVIVPSNTYIATINAVINCGLIPVFVEPDLASYNIDSQRIAEKITPRTRAIMLVHLYGRPCRMDRIMSICEEYNLKLVEDCAQCHGATFDGQMTGTFGVGAFSFYPTKNLGALGDAGGIATNDTELFQKMKAWRNYGSNVKYKNEYIGDNSRLDEVLAAFLRVKLKGLDAITQRKIEIADLYFKGIKTDCVLPLENDDHYKNVFHIFPIRHEKRDALKQYLLENGIKTEIHYPIAPIDQRSIQDWAAKNGVILRGVDFELSRIIHNQELSLPCSPIHSDAEIERVIEVLNKF